MFFWNSLAFLMIGDNMNETSYCPHVPLKWPRKFRTEWIDLEKHENRKYALSYDDHKGLLVQNWGRIWKIPGDSPHAVCTPVCVGWRWALTWGAKGPWPQAGELPQSHSSCSSNKLWVTVTIVVAPLSVVLRWVKRLKIMKRPFLCHNRNKRHSTHSSRLGSNFVSFIKPFQTVPASDTSATRDDN